MDGHDHDHQAFKLLLSFPSGLTSSQVSVDFSKAYDRIPHTDVDLENFITEIWEQRVQQSPSLFNGTKFRYGGYISYDNTNSNQEPQVCLQLGLTDYRTFVGTNLNPSWEKFISPSQDDCIQCKHTSSPLGNGAIVKTSDNKILVLQRSHNVGEFPGHYVFPGGHPEPQEVGIISHNTGDLNINKKISEEMFDSIVREVVEEIGVPSSSLSKPVFIGISRRVMNVRPAAFFFIRCDLTSSEIQRLYSSAVDGYESTQLYAVSMDELKSMACKMPGCHQGGFALYQLMVNDDVMKRTTQL